MFHARVLTLVAVIVVPGVAGAQLQVVGTTPALNAVTPVASTISIQFDRALDTSTVNGDSFRVFGQWSGAVQGTYTFSNGDRTATLAPNRPFSAGELVFVNLSHDLRAADTSSLRAAGYAYQFLTAVAPSSANFEEIDSFSNRTNGQTRIYGAAAGDLDGDGYLDLATVNEVSADVRVFLNRGDGSGQFAPMLPPQGIGVEASPNFTADFDNDGRVDLCVGAADSEDVWILLGAGDGTFSTITGIPMGNGSEPHGVAPLDVDGDGDLDVVSANVGSNDLALLVNDGTGAFAAPVYFDAGVDGEYSLFPADMDGDGITDLVVGARNGEQIVTLLGNGDGTFTAAGPPQSSGGSTWVVVLGDVNGDGRLDAATANDGSGTIGVLLGQGDGTFGPVSTIDIGAHVPSVDLGDLDGDGDLDMVVSSFGGGFWRWYRNDGSGSFTAVDAFVAPDNPSCAVLFDSDNDGDLDLALTDEIADVVVLMRNGDAAALCSPSPQSCRKPTQAGKSTLLLKDDSPDESDILMWKWTKGEATSKAEFGEPVSGEGYAVCLYDDGALLLGLEIPGGQTCAGGRLCWKEIRKGFAYRDKELTPDGMLAVKLLEGVTDGAAKLKLKGKGGRLGLPDLSQLTGVLDVQVQQTGGVQCWGATYTSPFKKYDGSSFLKAVSDDTSSLGLAPLWSAIHGQVIGPACTGCHGGSGGLSGLGDCNTALANLVGVASTELPSMNRVEAGIPSSSWIMHKLDGTQGMFTDQCAGMFCGSQMPIGGPFLQPELRDAIRTWIADGALNDCP